MWKTKKLQARFARLFYMTYSCCDAESYNYSGSLRSPFLYGLLLLWYGKLVIRARFARLFLWGALVEIRATEIFQARLFICIRYSYCDTESYNFWARFPRLFVRCLCRDTENWNFSCSLHSPFMTYSYCVAETYNFWARFRRLFIWITLIVMRRAKIIETYVIYGVIVNQKNMLLDTAV